MTLFYINSYMIIFCLSLEKYMRKRYNHNLNRNCNIMKNKQNNKRIKYNYILLHNCSGLKVEADCAVLPSHQCVWVRSRSYLSGMHADGDLTVQVALGDHVGAAGVHHPRRLQGLHKLPADGFVAASSGHLLKTWRIVTGTRPPHWSEATVFKESRRWRFRTYRITSFR